MVEPSTSTFSLVHMFFFFKLYKLLFIIYVRNVFSRISFQVHLFCTVSTACVEKSARAPTDHVTLSPAALPSNVVGPSSCCPFLPCCQLSCYSYHVYSLGI